MRKITKDDYLFETFWQKNTVRSQTIYITLLIVLILSICLLNLIKIKISTNSSGVIRPKTEKIEIKTLVPGIIDSIFINEGAFVHKGDTLLIINNEEIKSKLVKVEIEFNKIKKFINDIKLLNKDKTPKSLFYKKKLKEYSASISNYDIKINKNKKELDRNRSLFKKGFITEKEFDDLELKLEVSIRDKESFKSTFETTLQKEYTQYTVEYNSLIDLKKQLKKQLLNYIIKAPISGYIQGFSSIVNNLNINTGQTLALISPNSKLIAEIYISPNNIGYMKKNQDVVFTIHAFNYNHWVTIKGKVTDIAEDFIVVNQKPVFKIKCAFNQTYLKLRNGFKGKLKKGMTLNARFILTERSLYDLLFDKIDNWLNPNLNN